MDWQEKANKIMASVAYEAWEKANRLPNGRLRKKHVPYDVPDFCKELAECLGNPDQKAAEERAKAIMMYDYDAVKTYNKLSQEKK